MKTLKPRASSRPSAEEALRVAGAAAPMQPPAQIEAADKATTLNLRIRARTLRAILEAAETKSLTAKQVVTHALAASGLDVAEADLEDRTPRRKL